MSIAMFTACKDDDKVSDPSSLIIDHTMIDVLRIGGQTLIAVKTDLAWEATVADSWVSISPASGSGSEIIEVTIDRNLYIHRNTEISFTSGAVTKTVHVSQRGLDEQYVNTRKDRKVLHTYLEGTTATVTWDSPTEDNVISELEYETVSGELRTVTIPPGESVLECLDVKPGVKYKTRSGFVPPDAVDTLYKNWATSKYPFINLPTGVFTVDKSSYCYSAITGELVDPLPQMEYSRPNTILIEIIEEGTYRISDLFGGYYEQGRGLDQRYACWGIFNYDGAEFKFGEFKMDIYNVGFQKVEIDLQPPTTLIWKTYNGNNAHHLILNKGEPQEPVRIVDSDGYTVVENLPFRETRNYGESAVRWPRGNIGGWGDSDGGLGVLAYKVTVNRAGRLKVIDNASPGNFWFVLSDNKESADNGETTYMSDVDGSMAHDVIPGTYYVFGVLNSWYPEIDPSSIIPYDIEITLE
jgi:hypothetical protein